MLKKTTKKKTIEVAECPFKIHGSQCRLMINYVFKDTNIIDDSYLIGYRECIGEEICPILNK